MVASKYDKFLYLLMSIVKYHKPYFFAKYKSNNIG